MSWLIVGILALHCGGLRLSAGRPRDPCWFVRIVREAVLRTTKSAGNPERLSGGSFGEAFSGRRSIGRGSTEVFPEPRKMSALDTREGHCGQGRSLGTAAEAA